MKRALLSVSDKNGIIELGKFLVSKDFEIVSSGGTRKVLEEAGIEATDISKVTGNPEAFGGRMKTLSFQVSSALLFRRGHKEDEVQAKQLGIEPIDLVVCNLYPFKEHLHKGAKESELIEFIDIGGPTMIRAAAKNFDGVSVLTNPSQYKLFMDGFKEECPLDLRKKFSLEAFRHTAMYDSMIAGALEKEFEDKHLTIGLTTENSKELRYGENPHQKAWVIPHSNFIGDSLASVTPIQGKALSYNNYLDADAAWRCNSDLHKLVHKERPSCVTIIKHANPCGAAIATTTREALELAWAGDPISSFGSIIAFNSNVDLLTWEFLSDKFVEVLIAPGFDQDVLEKTAKKKNLRLLELAPGENFQDDYMLKSIHGGFVIQEEDSSFSGDLKPVTQKIMDDKQKETVEFGLRVGKHLKSNAIALVRQNGESFQLIGAGMGNPNRLISLEQSVLKAKENGLEDFSDCVLISDAFFPFKDNIEMANEFGIKNIVQPGGSIKDQEVIDCCDELGISMVFTGRRHFRH